MLKNCNPACHACHYKELDYPTQLERKQNWAEQQLKPWTSVLKEIRLAPENERVAYRSKSWMKSFYDSDGLVSFGMYRSIRNAGKWEKEFVSWDTCPIHTESIQKMITKLKVIFSHQKFEKSLVGVWLGAPHLVIVSREPQDESVRQLNWKDVLVPPFDQIWFHHNSQVGKKIFGHRPIELIYGPSNGIQIHPIRAFRQVAQSLLHQARRLAVESLLKENPKLVLDLYCGTGEISNLLPTQVGWIGIEFSKEAVEYANSIRDNQRSVHLAYPGLVEHRLQDPRVQLKIENPYSLYLNPPRSGLSQEASEKISSLIHEKPPKAIVYLSCSASSLSRDLPLFEKEGYKVTLLQPFDFFPQTEHFETLAILNKVLSRSKTKTSGEIWIGSNS